MDLLYVNEKEELYQQKNVLVVTSSRKEDGDSPCADMSGGKVGHSHCNVRDTTPSAPASEKSWVKTLKQFENNGKHKYLALTGAVILPMCFLSATMSIREEKVRFAYLHSWLQRQGPHRKPRSGVIKWWELYVLKILFHLL